MNRIYIVVGLLAILVIAAAFVLPRFVQWSDYRERMEVLASGVLGADVTILGEIEFSLLPQPRLHFSEVVVGDLEEPVASVGDVEAEFALIEFLRDQYELTRLVLREPVVDLIIDENGLFSSDFAIGEHQGAIANISLQQAQVVDGRLRLSDLRADRSVSLEEVTGDLRLTAFTGPFQFQGIGTSEEGRVQLRFNSSALDAEGNARVSAYYNQVGRYALTVEGLLTPGLAPRLDGTLTYRQVPPEAEAAEDIRGDLVLESRLAANTDRIVLSGYNLVPDENRPGTRLTGAASVQLGANASFDAVISGGVFALPPRDATEDQSAQPYELVRLLRELPAPPRPPLPGRVGVDLAEMNLRGFSLRNVRLDAETDGGLWTVRQFVARMAGETELRATGTLSAEGGRPGFTGEVSAGVGRLDALVQLWRRPAEDNPLFNLPASYSARAILGSDALGFTDGTLVLNGVNHRLGMRIGFGEEPRLDLTGRFGVLSGGDSAVLAAMAPDIMGGPTFGVSFPQGSFSLRAAEARIMGLPGRALAAEGDWGPGFVEVDRLAAEDLGGARFDLSGLLGGSLADPELSARGTLGVDSAAAPALGALYERFGVPAGWRQALGRSVPAQFDLTLDEPTSDGAQDLRLRGSAGVASVDFAVRLGEGIEALVDGPLALRMFVEADDAEGLWRQAGLDTANLFAPGEPVFVALNLNGTPANSLSARIRASAGAESVGYEGTLTFPDEAIHGVGTLDAELEDAGGLAALLGGREIALPPLSGRAELRFEGIDRLRLDAISGTSGETGFSGRLSAARAGALSEIEGELVLDSASIEALAAAMLGRAGVARFGEGPWPDGPIVIEPAARQTRASIAVATPVMTLGGREALADAGFELAWDATRLRLVGLRGRLGAGTLTADLTLCCASGLEDKTLSGRMTLDAVAIDAVAPPAIASSLSGTLSAGMRFEGSGADVTALLDGLAGEGSFALSDLTVANLDPTVYGTVAGLDGILEMDPDALRTVIGLALDLGSFRADAASGAFAIAGGVARATNLAIEGNGARLSGGVSLALDTMALDGAFAMTPHAFEDAAGMIGEDTARIVSRFSGTPWAIDRVIDIDTMVAALQVRANEIEVERLEALRLEDEARQRAAAEERNRLIREQMRQRAEAEAARRAAEEALREEQESEAGAGDPGGVSLQPGFNLDAPLGMPPARQQPFFVPIN